MNKTKFESCMTVSEMFAEMQKQYDCTQKLGTVTKTVIINNLHRFILISNLKKNAEKKQ